MALNLFSGLENNILSCERETCSEFGNNSNLFKLYDAKFTAIKMDKLILLVVFYRYYRRVIYLFMNESLSAEAGHECPPYHWLRHHNSG